MERKHRIQPRDIEHGFFNRLFGDVGLPSRYAFRLTLPFRKGSKGGLWGFLKRMPILVKLGLFEVPSWQKRTDKPWRNFKHYKNTAKLNELLKERGRFIEHVPASSSSPWHDTYTACLLAEFYMGADRVGGAIELQHEIIDRLGLDAKPREVKVGTTKSSLSVREKRIRITIGDVSSEIDAVFAIDVNNKPILVFVETDRATEPVRTDNDVRRSWGPRINFYTRLIGEQFYKPLFDVTCGALVLIPTVSTANRDNILSRVLEKHPNGCNYFLAHSEEGFGYEYHPPETLDVLHWHWARAGRNTFQFIPTEPLPETP